MTQNLEQESKVNGRWTKEEHQKFILGLELYGKEWKKIQALIATRNGAQIRSHAQKYFLKLKKESQPAEQPEAWEQTKETPPEYQNQHSSLVSNLEPETRPEFSYYLNKIVQKDAFKESFDFWDCLVDHKPLNLPESGQGLKRKTSFVNLNLEQELMEDSQPTKKIKCE